MGYLQLALAHGYRPLGHKPNQTETKVLVQIEDVRSKAWTVSGLNSLPLEWLAMKCDVGPRQLDRALQALVEAKVLEHDGGHIHIRRTERTRPWATYRLSPIIVGTESTYGHAEIYVRTVVHGMKRHASAMYTIRKKHPDWSMVQAWNAFQAEYPEVKAWCNACAK